MTGCAPAELLGGGRSYFDALTERVAERRALGFDTNELLASILEVSFASYRALLAIGGAKKLPEPLTVTRPGQRQAAKRRGVNWRELQRKLASGRH